MDGVASFMDDGPPLVENVRILKVSEVDSGHPRLGSSSFFSTMYLLEEILQTNSTSHYPSEQLPASQPPPFLHRQYTTHYSGFHAFGWPLCFCGCQP